MSGSVKTRGDESEVWVIEFSIDPEFAMLFQGLLQGEDGLAQVRSFASADNTQQLWVPLQNRDDVLEWLESLPGKVQRSLKLGQQYLWQA